MIAMNGHIIAQGSQFSLKDVEVVTATLDIEDVRSHRTSRSRGLQAAGTERYHRIEIPFALSRGKLGDTHGEQAPALRLGLHQAKFHTPEEEIAFVHVVDARDVRLTGGDTDSDLRVGCGITCVVRELRGTSYR